MTRRKKVLLAALVATIFVLASAGLLVSRFPAPGYDSSPFRGSQTSGSRGPGREATPSVSSGDATASRSSTPTPISPRTDSGARNISPVLAAEPLARVDVVPERTLAFAKPTAASAGDTYSIEFAPYGYGPGGKRRSLVVRVNRSTPVGKPRISLPLEGRNVLLDVSGLRSGKAIEIGGRYSGTIVFAPKDGSLIPTLQDVR